MPFVRLVERRLVINPGSIGMPYGRPGGAWALLHDGQVSLRHTSVDLDVAIAAVIAGSGYPERAAWAEEYVRAVNSDADALAPSDLETAVLTDHAATRRRASVAELSDLHAPPPRLRRRLRSSKVAPQAMPVATDQVYPRSHPVRSGDSIDYVTYDLDRFVAAQNSGGTYDQALSELRAGHKTSHWMWFVFPQIAGLGRSGMAQRYAIADLDEARAYLTHPVLGPRLVTAAESVLSHRGSTAEDILGGIDAIKLRSSMTLFVHADESQAVFRSVLDVFFDGDEDPATLDRL